ncbi:hypothetical protein AHAS_Ahas02G0003700 [Arachis hypogaea]
MADRNPSTDDLDQLLDCALDDFQTFNLNNSSAQRSGEATVVKKEAPSLPSRVQGLGMGGGLPDLKNKKKGKQKAPKDAHVSEALDKLREQTREAVKGLEFMAPSSADDFGKDAMMEDWVKQFEDLAGSQDMESIVETMMRQLLSKEILHDPMKEIGERYPKWLEEHKSSLSKEDYDRYSHQYELIQNLNEVYENDSENFTKIVDLMHKMQECGQPPNDIVQELAPDFDLASLGQMDYLRASKHGLLNKWPKLAIYDFYLCLQITSRNDGLSDKLFYNVKQFLPPYTLAAAGFSDS